MRRDGRYNTTAAADRRAAKLRGDGLSWKAIGEKLGVSDKTAKVAAERGAFPSALNAESAGDSELRKLLKDRWRRLSDPELRVMRARRDGETLKAIGEKLGVTKQRIAALQRRAEAKLREEDS